MAKGEIGRKEYEDGLKTRQRGKVLLNMIGAGLSAPTDSVAGIAAAAASPAVSYQIGQYFKGLAQKNPDGRLTADQKTAHILAHGVLGAAVSAAGGNDALAGALASGGTEAAAPVIGRWLYGKGDGGSLSAEEKETVSAITRMLGAAAGAAAGNSSADVVRGGMAADEAVGNNFYLTPEALKRDEQTARKIYSVIKEQVKHECSSKGRITECRQNIGRIIEFTQDKRFDGKFKDLKKESLYYLNQHLDLVASYLKAEYEKLDREDKSILYRYISPGAEIVSGSLGVVLSGVAGGGSCAETFGLGCAAALVGVTSSYDHVITGTKNFGKKASEQRPTITVQTLKQLGLSEQAAEYIQFSIDLFSVGKSGAGMPKAKPVSDAKPRWEVDRKLNKLTTCEQVEKNVQEIRNGNKNSNFNQHAQIEKEIKKLSRGPSGLIGKEFEDWLVKFHGGNGSFKMGGREFDGAITINRWYEAKSGNFWRDHTSTPQKFAKFKSDMGDRLKIATENGATYELHSNTPIPKDVKEFLNKKGIKYFEY